MSARPLGYPRFEIGAQFPHTQNSFIFLDQLDCFWQVLEQTLRRGTPIKKVSITLHGLAEYNTPQYDLFPVLEPQKQKQIKGQGKLWHAIDQLNTRFGNDSVHLASQHSLKAKYLGTKIAFTRVPELEEFYE